MSDVLLPGNSTKQERDIEAVIAPRIEAIPVVVREVWNPDTCPAQVLPWMAWSFSVDEWSPLWSDAQKRASIKASVGIHKYKGTFGAVREAVAALGVESEVQEWFQQIPAGSPYTFRLNLSADQTGIPQDFFKTVLSVVFRTKNLRSHLDKIQVIVRTKAGPKVAAVAGIGQQITLDGYIKPAAVINETTICM